MNTIYNNVTKYYACIARYREDFPFHLLYGEHGNGNSGKLCVVTSTTKIEEAELIFERAFPVFASHEKAVVDVTKLVEDGIIPKERLEILEVIVKRN